MKNINFKITGNHVKQLEMLKLNGDYVEKVETRPIRVANVTVSYQTPDGEETDYTYRFGSYNTDKDDFSYFLVRMKRKLKDIYENAKTIPDLITADRNRFVREGDYIFIMDIK